MTAAHRFALDAIGAGLPVAAAEAELRASAARGVMVVTAPPGTGKTTFVPALVADLVAARGGGRTVLTQPRRVAVRAAAARIAALDGGAVGGAVGFTVRGERAVGAGTRLEAVTPGVLLRRLLGDPELAGVDAVILDEVHERSLDGELLLGMLAELRSLREDLLLVAMSATLDADRVAEVLGDASGAAPIVAVPAALHPLRVEYAPPAEARLDARGAARGFLAHLAELAARAQREDGVDALVFVPGAREVDALLALLRGRPEVRAGGVEVLPLHGRVPARDQDRAVRGRRVDEPPRIVVSTALAESSLTVPGVRLVIDAGLSRELRRDRSRDMTGLVTVSASRSSAEQRAGRAARQGPGRAIRAYSEAEFARMLPDAAPEIASADLADAALALAAWGAPGGRGFRFPTPPPPGAMARAEATLGALGLVSPGTGGITPLGRTVAGLPVGVREARALLAGAVALGDAARAAEVVAAIADDHRDAGADLPRLLRELRGGRAPGAARWRRERDRLARIAREHAATSGPAAGTGAAGAVARSDAAAAGIVLALARPEWIARRVSEGSRAYLLASGTRAALPEGSALLDGEWIAVREVQRAEGRAAAGTGAVIRLAAPFEESGALALGDALLTRTRASRIEDGRVRVREERRLGAILLAATPVAARPEDTAPAFTAHLRELGLGALDWPAAAVSLRGRLALLHRELGEPWPRMDDASLLGRLEDWLGPELARLRPGASLDRLDMATALRRLLPWPEAAQLDALAPERLPLPSGGSARIDYPAPGRGAVDDGAHAELPVIAAKLQECFGLADTPRLVAGRVPVLVHLLSPARRPLAVTADLSSFWNGPYQEVRREMRGRYPKHPWPEDPWTAQATARTKRSAAGRPG
ncbi:ATP-dependent helicase HrpB [Leucobacter allii]|uniref:ATP-dependent helicase HrpB n=1 Tax=Leucobacter allii TaxID=2932247 RepID=A0ABY4FPJ2_9MICO|nr:ATP-dependent helicase HrpB [Leucobacter allii]UOQ58205.1 ATP-dependent helicase HrpB [Leucobacter allii]